MKTKERTKQAMCPCEGDCPLGIALSIVGGKWKSRLICTLYVDGTARYNDLLKKTKGITNAALSSALKQLEGAGIVLRKQYNELPLRVEYSITEAGRELLELDYKLIPWEKKFCFG